MVCAYGGEANIKDRPCSDTMVPPAAGPGRAGANSAANSGHPLTQCSLNHVIVDTHLLATASVHFGLHA